MRKASRAAIVAIALVLVAGVLITSARRSGSAATIVGAVSSRVRRGPPPADARTSGAFHNCAAKSVLPSRRSREIDIGMIV